VLWLITLPFRLAFGILAGVMLLPIAIVLLPFALLIWLPLMILKTGLKLVIGLIVLPIALVVILLGAVAAGVGLVVATVVAGFPIALVALCVWLLTRSSPAATVVRG